MRSIPFSRCFAFMAALLMLCFSINSFSQDPVFRAYGDFEEREPGEEKPLDAYQLFLARRMADGVRIAINNLAHAKIAGGAGAGAVTFVQPALDHEEKVLNPFGEMDAVQFNPGVNSANKKEPAGKTDPDLAGNQQSGEKCFPKNCN